MKRSASHDDSLGLQVYLKEFLLAEGILDKLQEFLRLRAPSWTEGLHIWRFREKPIHIDVSIPGALATATNPVIGKRGPLYEELKKRFGAGNERITGSVELRGSDMSLQIVLMADQQGFSRIGDSWNWGNSIHFGMPRNKVNGMDSTDWSRAVFGEVCDLFSAPYARGVAANEFDAKNISHEGGGVMAVGIDASKYLPGLYWLNYFGKPYCDLIGKQRLLSAPAHRVKEGKAGVILEVADDPMAWNTPERREADSRLLDHLGPQFFFSKERKDIATMAPNFGLV